MPIISIIVPVYNVEKYLQRCVDSILVQTFTDFELILVDDGSTDKSGKICDQYAKKDQRIQVVHQANGGVACARNRALDIAQGQYVAFCDSDDSWEPFLLAEVYSKAVEYLADCVPYNYMAIAENREVKYSNFVPGLFELENENTKFTYLLKMYLACKHGFEVWNRLFRKAIIENHSIRFCTQCNDFGEDIGFVFKYMCYSKRVYCLDKPCYHYYIRSDSITGQSINKMRLNELNEVCYDIEPTFYSVFQTKKIKKQFPIIHFLIMNHQYSKLICTPQYPELSGEIQKLDKIEWYREKVKGLRRCYQQLKIYFGIKEAKQIILFSGYCLHGNWKRFSIESLVFYKWII